MNSQILQEFLKMAWRHKELAGQATSQEALRGTLAQLPTKSADQTYGFWAESDSRQERVRRINAQTGAVTSAFISVTNPNLRPSLERTLHNQHELPQILDHLTKLQASLTDARNRQNRFSQLANTPALLSTDDTADAKEIEVILAQALSHQKNLLKTLNEVLVREVSQALSTNGFLAHEDFAGALERATAEAEKKVLELPTQGHGEIVGIVLGALQDVLSTENPMLAYVQQELIKQDALKLFKASIALMQKLAQQHKSLSQEPQISKVATAAFPSSEGERADIAAAEDLSKPPLGEEKRAEEIMQEVLWTVYSRKDIKEPLLSLIVEQKAFLNELKVAAYVGSPYQIELPRNQSYPPRLADVRVRIAGQTESVGTLLNNKPEELEGTLKNILSGQDFEQSLARVRERQKCLTEADDQQKQLLQLSKADQAVDVEGARQMTQTATGKLQQAFNQQNELVGYLDQVLTRDTRQALTKSGILAQKDAIVALHQTMARAKEKGPQETVRQWVSHFARKDPTKSGAVNESQLEKDAPRLFVTSLEIIRQITNQCEQEINAKLLPKGFTLSNECIAEPGNAEKSRIFLPPIHREGGLIVCEVNTGIEGGSQAGPKPARVVPQQLMPDLRDLEKQRRFAHRLREPQSAGNKKADNKRRLSETGQEVAESSKRRRGVH